MHAFKIIIKVTLQRKIYFFSFLSFFLLTNILLLNYYHPDISIMEFLSFSMRVGQIGFSFFIFFAYECFSDLSKLEYTETVSLYKEEKSNLIGTQLIIVILIVFIWSLIIFLWQIGWYIHFQCRFTLYIVHMILAIVLNCFIPGCIATLLGCTFGLSVKRTYAYCLILFFIIITSNIPSKILYSLEFLGVPILNHIDWFSIQMPNSSFVADSVYGISIEAYRWFLAIGWLSVLSMCIYTKMPTNSICKKKLIYFSLLLLAIIAGCRFSQRQEDSIVRKDYRSDGILLSEITFRSNEISANTEAPTFQITHYDLEITINSKMHIYAQLTLDQTDLDVYNFTLWHSLNIINISDIDGNSIPYDRSGDYLSIYIPNNIKTFCIEYNGNCGKYFTNYQGIALPGYLPYFPMAGHINIWDYSNQEIITQHTFSPKNFIIKINSNLKVHSNLPLISHNTFAGTAETVSLYAGLLSEIDMNMQHVYSSPVSYPRNIIVGYEEQWQNLSNLVGETRKLELKQKIIFVQPETIMATKSSHENLVIFDDHIIVGAWDVNAESICRNYLFSLIPESEETYLLSNLFKQHIAFGRTDSKCIPPDIDDLTILTKYTLPNHIQEENDWYKYINAKKLYEDLWNYKIESLGEPKVLKSVYEYLLSNNRNQDQVYFLFELGVD